MKAIMEPYMTPEASTTPPSTKRGRNRKPQKGWISRQTRKTGDVWYFNWREYYDDGRPPQKRAMRIGTVKQFPAIEHAYVAAEHLRRNAIDPVFAQQLADRVKCYNKSRPHGCTPQQYKSMYDDQNGRCAICHTIYPTLCVDHDHDTTEIRGLLCSRCNQALGLFKDSSDVLIDAAAYLKKCGK